MSTEQELWSVVEDLLRRLRAVPTFSAQTTDAGKRYDAERDGREMGGLILALAGSDARRAKQERESLRLQIEEAVTSYAMAWQPGWRVPPGYVECDGAAWWRGTQDGPHVRPAVSRASEVMRDGPPHLYRGLGKPELRDGERIIETMGSPVITITRGIPRGSPPPDEYPETERAPLGRYW